MSCLLAILAVLDVAAYRAELSRIDALLARGDTASAATAAQALEHAEIEGLAPDLHALGPIARGEPHRARLRELIDALDAPVAETRPADLPLLSRLRAQRVLQPKAGGEIEQLDAPGASLRDRAAGWVKRALRFVWRQIKRFLRWLGGLIPDGGRTPGRAEARGILWLVIAGVGMIFVFLLALALLSLRRRPPAMVREAGAPRASDDDPLSRTVMGWADRARELAAAGRRREAIRAWYHAVLMQCAARGFLHQRRGRTNWEYARALPPSVPWRDRFADLTLRFDIEWYGQAETTDEALDSFAAGANEILRAVP